jgi:hypothetical protein
MNLRDGHILLTRTPNSHYRRNSDSHPEHDLLRADFTFCDVVEPIADDLFQPSIELLHRDMLQLSVLDQSRNLLQERGQSTPGFLVGHLGRRNRNRRW